ncbi:MAG: hypothetical protein KGZ86_06990 [Candidatus Latescibacteria bacterium]|nr:hypothetical protein [Candidatus Latescibacterota bacterium]
MLSDLEKLISQLTKIKKKLDTLGALTPEQISAKPYEIEAHISDISRQLNTPPLPEMLGETKLFQELKNLYAQEQEKIDNSKQEFRFNIGNQFKDLLSGFGELKGQLPVLRVKFYTIKFDFNNGEATIWWGPEKELIKKLNLEPVAIVETLKSFDQNLTVKWNQYLDFLNIIKQAYSRYLKLNSLNFGEKVNLFDLLTEVVILMQGKSFKTDPTKSHFTDYSRIQYSYDLFRLKTDSALMSNIQLSVATFAITEDRAKSLWVPDKETGDGTYYQTIAFRKDEHE